jgi:hypothetical protein
MGLGVKETDFVMLCAEHMLHLLEMPVQSDMVTIFVFKRRLQLDEQCEEAVG